MGRPCKRRAAARQREAQKKIKVNIDDPLAWTFQDPWRTVQEVYQSNSVVQDVTQPTAPIAVPENVFPLPPEPSPLPEIPMPETDIQPSPAVRPMLLNESLMLSDSCFSSSTPAPLSALPLDPMALRQELDGPSLGVFPVLGEERPVSFEPRFESSARPQDYIPHSTDTSATGLHTTFDGHDSSTTQELTVGSMPVLGPLSTFGCASGTDHSTVGTHKTSPQNINLVRSSTLIVEIPGLPAGKVCNTGLDCYCSACLKWDTVATKPAYSTTIERMSVEESSEAVSMKKVYGTLRNMKATCRFINKSKCTLRPGKIVLRKVSKHISVKRYRIRNVRVSVPVVDVLLLIII
ncbi:uncharacterized protein LOC134209043 [Armigeres subalbatus]|uniref:uncharacterized protein LOC134209043 n=1 Tax=Armigeres subalbatus TaxID=124917 RepID=UPI002ED5008D